MMRYFTILLFMLFYTAISLAQQNKTPGEQYMDSLFREKARQSIGKDFPQFKAVFNGKLISNDSLRGKVVFINFWFKACPPCIAEMPALNELYKKLKGNKSFEFLSFTYENSSNVRAFIQKYKVQYKIASVSRNECYRLNQNNGFPTSIIVGKDGKIRELYTGGDADAETSREFILTTVYDELMAQLKK